MTKESYFLQCSISIKHTPNCDFRKTEEKITVPFTVAVTSWGAGQWDRPRAERVGTEQALLQIKAADSVSIAGSGDLNVNRLIFSSCYRFSIKCDSHGDDTPAHVPLGRPPGDTALVGPRASHREKEGGPWGGRFFPVALRRFCFLGSTENKQIGGRAFLTSLTRIHHRKQTLHHPTHTKD